jgi:hypothetical protein
VFLLWYNIFTGGLSMKDIEMITTFIPDKLPIPYRFRIAAEDQSLLVVKINHILFAEEDKKEQKIKYRCTCTINGIKRTYDIYYMKESMKWYIRA